MRKIKGKTEMKKNNLIIRKALRENNVYLWELADILGVSEATLIRKMRKEYPEEEQLRIAEMISEYAKTPKASEESKTADWKNSYEYKRILEILDDYWLSEPEEVSVRIEMHFEHAYGLKQDKVIEWHNPSL